MAVRVRRWAGLAIMLATALGASTARAQVEGGDAAACTSGAGPAIEARIAGLKDRTGDIRLELYPPNEQDFLKDDRDLIAQGKLFRRVIATPPASGPVAICIRVPKAGTYALFFVHNRDGRNKFNFWSDGAGFVDSTRIGRARPKLQQALVNVGPHVTVVTIRAQYLRGLSGFGPSEDKG